MDTCRDCDEEVSLRRGRCGRPACGRVFYVCRPCDRGQVYCSRDCSEMARVEDVRAARARYRDSDEARADHRDYVRAWRASRRFVRDQGSQKVAPSSKVILGGAPAAAMDVAPASDAGGVPDAQAATPDQADSVGDPPLGELRRGGDPPGGAAAVHGAAPTGGADPDRGPVPVVPAPVLRCAVCGRPGRFVRAGPLRRLRLRPKVHYEVEVVDPARRRRGLGSFRDLRQLALRGLLR